MRGKVDSGDHCVGYLRITPAYAGKRGLHRPGYSPKQDHPCICGEKQNKIDLDFDSIGSPLHMRGKGIKRGNNGRENRITPAYAGKRDKEG